MSTSTVPAMLAALAALYPTGFIGEPPRQQVGDFVAVGWNGPENAAVISTSTPGNLRPDRLAENYVITSQLVAWQGDLNLAACVTRAYALLDVLVNATFADKTFGGVCMSAFVTSSELHPVLTDQGAMATLSTDITVQAFA